MPPRYYAEYTETADVFVSQWSTSWQVFDRHFTDRRGAVLPICLCLNREHAFIIRDALNGTPKK